MKVLALTIMMPFVIVPAYADPHSNEPEEAPNQAETDKAEEDSKGDDFCNYSKD